MPGSCEVCSTESSKYRCPTCGLMSCSLACTQSHKIYCAPKAPTTQEPADPSPTVEANPSQNQDKTATDNQRKELNAAAVAASPQIKDFLDRHPQLRHELQEIYRATLADQWVEWHTPATRGRPHGRGGKGPSRRSRGQWTAEKGFNRGLGKVRKLRQSCDDGIETGPVAEGFMQFLALVHDGHAGQSQGMI
ncbi:hypothetical protein NUU61_009315 [Penicillium alfredii]|uniref:HIT-type domain-containing protein n=1 Tax=Penicillium alfredii TaxID=1506179 RepID=A0A9W9JX91_9EURO|nr:uncharacterized protein NUU61_009315 [Penicillium alfredii]KAJ5084736.1 hypothetical protein NUU61_009315 [Penicillium alfredii]